MSGGMKDFFDRTFYPVEGKLQPLPYAIFISAENDGTGPAGDSANRSGLSLHRGAGPRDRKGGLTETYLAQCRELGMALAAGLDAGIF